MEEWACHPGCNTSEPGMLCGLHTPPRHVQQGLEWDVEKGWLLLLPATKLCTRPPPPSCACAAGTSNIMCMCGRDLMGASLKSYMGPCGC